MTQARTAAFAANAAARGVCQRVERQEKRLTLPDKPAAVAHVAAHELGAAAYHDPGRASVERPKRIAASRPAGSNANGSATGCLPRFGHSCSTTRGCATKSAGPCSTASRARRARPLETSSSSRSCGRDRRPSPPSAQLQPGRDLHLQRFGLGLDRPASMPLRPVLHNGTRSSPCRTPRDCATPCRRPSGRAPSASRRGRSSSELGA